MFQFWADFNDLYSGNRSVKFSRSLNPELQTLDLWLAANKDRIPVGGERYDMSEPKRSAGHLVSPT